MFLSRPRRANPESPDPNAADPLIAEQLADHPALNAVRREQVHKLADTILMGNTAASKHGRSVWKPQVSYSIYEV